MPGAFLIPLRLDAAALAAEVRALPSGAWIPHFNLREHLGDWSGVALRSVGGDPQRIYPDPAAAAPFADTPLLAACPTARGFLAALPCAVESVRLLRLGVRARIHEHRDHDIGPGGRVLRLHAPVETNPSAELVVDGLRIDMRPNEVWALDSSLPHRAWNGGAAPRLHLVVDCVVDAWLAGLRDQAGAADAAAAASATSPAPLPRVHGGLQELVELVRGDRSLQESLRETRDKPLFVRQVCALAAAHGFQVEPAEVEEEMRRGRRFWLERWI